MNNTIKDLKQTYKILGYKQLGISDRISRAKKYEREKLEAEQDEILTDMIKIKHMIESIQTREVNNTIQMIEEEKEALLNKIDNCKCETTKRLHCRMLDIMNSDLERCQEELRKAKFGIL